MTNETEVPETAEHAPATQFELAPPRRSSLDLPDVNLRLNSPFISMHAFSVASKMASALAQSSMVPNDYRRWVLQDKAWIENPNAVGNCLIAIDLANRLRLGVMEVMQNVDMIHGRPAMRSKLITALINGSKAFAHELRYEENGKAGAEYGVRAWTTTKDGHRLDGPWITKKLVDAEGWSTRKGTKWATMPEKMYRYRAASWWADLHATHITLGIISTEDAEDSFGADVELSRAQLLEQKLAQSAEVLEHDTEAAEVPEQEPERKPRGTRRKIKEDAAPEAAHDAPKEEPVPQPEAPKAEEEQPKPAKPAGQEAPNLFNVE